MIETLPGIDVGMHSRLTQQSGNPRGEVRRARGRIGHPIELGREAAEVVDRFWLA